MQRHLLNILFYFTIALIVLIIKNHNKIYVVKTISYILYSHKFIFYKSYL